jgi:hypothetical protein
VIADNGLRWLNEATAGEAAVGYALNGFPILPCQHDSKVPATAHGSHDAYSGLPPGWSVEDLAARFDGQGLNVAVACGSMLDVLDIDVKHGAPGMRSLDRLHRAGLLRGAVAQSQTPSGGLHLFFPSSGANANGTLVHAGVDLRGRGGYVLAPPSVVDGRPYRWEFSRPLADGGPLDWAAVKRLLVPAPRRRPRLVSDHESGAALSAWMSEQLPGNRNAGLFWAASRVAETGGDPWLLADAAMSTGLSVAEVRITITSAIRGVS